MFIVFLLFCPWFVHGFPTEIVETSMNIDAEPWIQVGPALAMRGDLFGEAFSDAQRMAEVARPGQTLLSSAACAAGLEDLELRQLRDAGCIELSQSAVKSSSSSCICAEVPDTAKLSLAIAHSKHGIEALYGSLIARHEEYPHPTS